MKLISAAQVLTTAPILLPVDWARVLNAFASSAWHGLSAEQGRADAQSFLGFMYNYGSGVLQDKLTAHMWYNIASANGDKKAGDNRDMTASFMPDSDISKATVMARECMKSNYKKCGW